MSTKKTIAETDYTERTAEFLKFLAKKIESGESEVIRAKSSSITECPEYVTHTIIVKISN